MVWFRGNKSDRQILPGGQPQDILRKFFDFSAFWCTVCKAKTYCNFGNSNQKTKKSEFLTIGIQEMQPGSGHRKKFQKIAYYCLTHLLRQHLSTNKRL